MAVLYVEDPSFARHDPGLGHPESKERLSAVRAGVTLAGLDGELSFFEPRLPSSDELARVHDRWYLEQLQAMCQRGGGEIDADTAVSFSSYEAALHACGAGLSAVDRLRKGEAQAAFLAVRPPGHHARRSQAMGFCLINNAAVTTAALVADGERVLVLDLDAHHGNGTEEAFYGESEVLYISFHQSPLYPGTGHFGDVGIGKGRGATINLPLPPKSAGESYRVAMDELVVPAAERFAPSWLVVSLGYDAHRDDPLTDLGLSAGDYYDLVVRAMRLATPGRRIVFLEGGYDLHAISLSSGATLSAMCGSGFRPEKATGGPVDLANRKLIAQAIAQHEDIAASLAS